MELTRCIIVPAEKILQLNQMWNWDHKCTSVLRSQSEASEGTKQLVPKPSAHQIHFQFFTLNLQNSDKTKSRGVDSDRANLD